MIKAVKNLFGTGKRKFLTLTAMVSVMLMAFASSAGAAPATGNTDVDAIITELEGGFSTAQTAFVYLAVAAVPITLIVVLFFWLRGKFKQSVSGA